MTFSVNTGLGAQPAIGKPQAAAIVSQIDNKTSSQPNPSWDAKLEPVLAQRDQQIAAAQAAAAAAAQAAAAKAEAQRQAELATKQVTAIAPATPSLSSSSGNCADWIAGAGITDIADAEYLIDRESGCNPNAVNASSGACGIGQALPCSKMGCAMGDGQCQMTWMNEYCQERYGGWAGAAAHERNFGWY